MQNYLRRAWAEIHLDRLGRNVEKCRSLLSPENELMCVVKANCYGHGVEHILPYLRDCCGVKHYAVSNIVEAVELRKSGIRDDILILGYTPAENAPAIIAHDLIQTVTDLEYAKKLSKAMEKDPVKLRAHIAVDTGMTRIGLRGETCEEEAETIYGLPGLSVEGIFTHLSCADSEEDDDKIYTKNQIEEICGLAARLKKRGLNVGAVHFLNSAGCVYHKDARSDFARFGIMLYGLKPNYSLALPVDLEPVMELKACIAQVKTVEPGVYVSYGRTYKTERETKIATVTIGYADGYPRLLSGKSEVLVRGMRAPVIGRICMDQMMIDVSGVPNVCEGDTVTLFGRDGNDEITADDLADLIGTIGYEIVCGISPRVPRVEAG